jgi:hypothetical protein
VHGFEMLRARLERRQRLLNGLTAASWALLISVGIAIVALGGSALGLWGAVPLLPWVIAHALLGIVGFGIGWICPINSRELLFRADRHLQSHELLVTLYELSQGYGPAEFFPLLERRLAALSVTPARALPMGSGDRGRWAAVAILSFFCVSIASLVQPGWLPTESHLSATAPASHESPQASPLLDEWLQTLPPDLAQKLADMRERFERARRELALNPNDPRARAALQQLHAELLTEQERLAPPSPPTDAESSKKSSSDASVTEGSSSDLRPPQQSSSGAAKLDHIVQGLRSILEQAQGLSHEELKKLLEQLRDALPEVTAIAEQTWQETQIPQEFRQRLEELLRELEARQALYEQLEHLQREIESALAPPEPQTAHGEEFSQSSPNAPSPAEEGSQQAPSQQGSASAQAPRSQERSEESQPSAGAGRGTAPLDPEAAKDLPDLSELRERSRTIPVPPSAHDEDLDILFEIVSLELPKDPQGASSPTPAQINYERVEAVLDMLEIPQELRDAVRQYFLSLSRH